MFFLSKLLALSVEKKNKNEKQEQINEKKRIDENAEKSSEHVHF